MLRIEDFIPYYVDLSYLNSNPVYPNHPNLSSIPSKEEFRTLAAKPKQMNTDFQPFVHQEFIGRFFSPVTPYDRLLVMHDVGSGKSCVMFMIWHYLNETYKQKGKTPPKLYILVKNPEQEENIESRQLMLKCSNQTFYPEKVKEHYEEFIKARLKAKNKNILDRDAIQEEHQVWIQYISDLSSKDEAINQLQRLILKELRKYIKVTTWTSFLNTVDDQITSHSDEPWYQQYQDSYFLIDEAHNLRMKDELEDDKPITSLGRGRKRQEEDTTYNAFGRLELFLTLLKQHNITYKLACFTATPMRDRWYEIYYLLKILGKVDEVPPDSETCTENDIAQLTHATRGIVSYVRTALDYPAKVISVDNQRFIPCLMKGKQLEEYTNSTDQIKRLQLSQFASYNVNRGTNKKQIPVLPTEVRDNLSSYSATFSYMLKNLEELNPFHQPSKVFIYNIYKEKIGGILTLASVLDAFGYVNVTTLVEKPSDIFKLPPNRKSYLMYHQEYLTNKNEWIAAYNDPRNCWGEYIQIIIGTDKIAEGIDLLCVKRMYMLSFWWNIPKLQQITGRVLRTKGHKQLQDRQQEMIQSGYTDMWRARMSQQQFQEYCQENMLKSGVAIYRLVATTQMPITEESDSIQAVQLRKAEQKHIQVKRVERLLKQQAIDCELNRYRNILPPEFDHSEYCDYDLCNYECNVKSIQPYIQDTNRLLYDNVPIEKIQEIIKAMYTFKHSYTFEEIITVVNQYFPQEDLKSFTVYRSLDELIHSTYIFIWNNKRCKLRSKDGIYYLISMELNDINDTFYMLEQPLEQPAITFESMFVTKLEPKYCFRLDEPKLYIKDVTQDIYKVTNKDISCNDLMKDVSYRKNVGEDCSKLSISDLSNVIEYIQRRYNTEFQPVRTEKGDVDKYGTCLSIKEKVKDKQNDLWIRQQK